MTDVSGKTVLITGAAMGMGRLLAETMARGGAAKLALWDLNEEKLAEAAQAIEKLGPKVFTYKIDITNREAVYETAKKVKADTGTVQVLVNNAGVVHGGHFLDVSDDGHRHTMEVNILSYFWVTRAFLPDMIEKNEGHVVNMASAAGLIGVPGVSSYSASKFAVVGWTEALRLEMKKEGHGKIRFTTVCPSFVDTGMFNGIKPPFLTPLLTTEDMVAKIYKGIRKNKIFVMAPLMVRSVMPMKGIGIPAFTDFIAGLFGMHSAMDTWKGRENK